MRSQKWGKGCEAAFASITSTFGFGSTCALISGPVSQQVKRNARVMMLQPGIEIPINVNQQFHHQATSCCILMMISAHCADVSSGFLLQQQCRGLHSRMAVKPALHN